jgi:cobalamin biosynthesis protein CobT
MGGGVDGGMLGSGNAGSGICAALGALTNCVATIRPAATIQPDRRASVTPLDALLAIRLKAVSSFTGAHKVMEIYLDRRAIRQIRLAAQESIEEGDTESLREEVLEAFSEEQVEEIERRLDSGDFFEFLTDVLDEWGGDDADELIELLETQLAEAGIDMKTDARAETSEGEGEDDEDEDEDDEGDADADSDEEDDDAPGDLDEDLDDALLDDE